MAAVLLLLLSPGVVQGLFQNKKWGLGDSKVLDVYYKKHLFFFPHPLSILHFLVIPPRFSFEGHLLLHLAHGVNLITEVPCFHGGYQSLASTLSSLSWVEGSWDSDWVRSKSILKDLGEVLGKRLFLLRLLNWWVISWELC